MTKTAFDSPARACLPCAMQPDVFRHPYRVTYADCTTGNHVYYARYLDFLEAARNEFFRTLGCPFLEWQDQGIAFPVIECRLRYRSPARYDDLLSLEIWPTRAEGIRLDFAYCIRKSAGPLILEAETLHVCTGSHEKPKRLPGELCNLLQPFLRSAAR